MGLLVAFEEGGIAREDPRGGERRNPGGVADHAPGQVGPHPGGEVGGSGPEAPAREERTVAGLRHGQRERDGVLGIAAAQEEVGPQIPRLDREGEMIGFADPVLLVHDEAEAEPGHGTADPFRRRDRESRVLVDDRHGFDANPRPDENGSAQVVARIVEHLHAPLPVPAAPDRVRSGQGRDQRPGLRFSHRHHGSRDRTRVGADEQVDGIGGRQLPVDAGRRLGIAAVVPQEELHRSAADAPRLVQHRHSQPVPPLHLAPVRPEGTGRRPGARDRHGHLRVPGRGHDRLAAGRDRGQKENGERPDHGGDRVLGHGSVASDDVPDDALICLLPGSKPKTPVAVAPANRMARMAHASRSHRVSASIGGTGVSRKPPKQG